MKIGILIDRMNVGGVEKIALEEVKALRSLGENAVLIVLRKKGVVDNAFPDLQKQVPVIYLDEKLPKILCFSFQFPVFHFFSSFHVTYPLFIPFVIKNREFDYIIVHGTYTAFTAITIKWFKKIPFAVFIWDPISYIIDRVYPDKFYFVFKKILQFSANLLDKLILNNTDYILTGGAAHNKIFQKLNPKKEIIEIPPGVHTINKLQQKKQNYILLVTAWKKGKNPEYVFKLLEKNPTLKFKIVGKWLDPKYMSWFKNEIIKRKKQKNVIVIGEVTESQLSIYYQKALTLLQINDDRGFGLPALEAAAHGTTFIIPKGQGVCKLFLDGVDGFYTKEKETTAIVAYINQLVNAGKLASSMGKHAWKTVRNKYNWETHARRILHMVSASGR